jgi:hypothetical protein
MMALNKFQCGLVLTAVFAMSSAVAPAYADTIDYTLVGSKVGGCKFHLRLAANAGDDGQSRQSRKLIRRPSA